MERGYLKKVQSIDSIKGKMDFPIKIEELWDGIQCLSKTILLVASTFLPTPLDIQVTREHQYGRIVIKI